MVEIRRIPPPLTQIDPAPKTTPRNNPGDVAIDKTRDPVAPQVERRQNPDRRRGRGGSAFDRRISNDRRRRNVDISV